MVMVSGIVFLAGVWVLCSLVSERRGCLHFLTWVLFGMLVVALAWAFSSGLL